MLVKRFGNGAHIRVAQAEHIWDRPLWQSFGMPEAKKKQLGQGSESMKEECQGGRGQGQA